MKRGFTLVEMLAVVAVLAILALLTIPIVSNQLKESSKELYETQIQNIKEATKNWAADHLDLLPESGSYEITLKDLQDGGYIKKKLRNPKNKKLISSSSIIQIIASGVGGFSVNVNLLSDFEGLKKGTYSSGSTVDYAGLKWKVIKDNGSTTTLILSKNYTTGSFGTSADWSSSSAKNILNNTFVNAYSIIKADINDGGIIYDNTSKSYVRLPERDEVSSSISNDSNTPFWTKTEFHGSYVYYATSKGQFKVPNYQIGPQVPTYLGYGRSINDIVRNFDGLDNRNECLNLTESGYTETIIEPNKSSALNSRECTAPSQGVRATSYRTVPMSSGSKGYEKYIKSPGWANGNLTYGYVCYCAYASITSAACKGEIESTNHITCDMTYVNDNSTLYLASTAVANARTYSFSEVKKDIGFRPVITVKEK